MVPMTHTAALVLLARGARQRVLLTATDGAAGTRSTVAEGARRTIFARCLAFLVVVFAGTA